MKFRVSKEDLIIFIIFCILLLYLCAIGVMNFVTFGAEGHMWGLNPFPAFGHEYIAATLVLFFLALITIFTSVSSHIFTREKGPGIGIKVGEKEEKGCSRWAKDKEIKEDFGIAKIDSTSPSIDAAGVALCYDKNNIWVDNGEYHTLVIGSSGSGKTRCVVKPLVVLVSITVPSITYPPYSRSVISRTICVNTFGHSSAGRIYDPAVASSSPLVYEGTVLLPLFSVDLLNTVSP